MCGKYQGPLSILFLCVVHLCLLYASACRCVLLAQERWQLYNSLALLFVLLTQGLLFNLEQG